MLLEIVRSTGLSHLSYFLGDGNEAAVIDPRRDYDIYLDIATREGLRITRIFETHRNEDYVIGSQALASATGAEIYHGRAIGFGYGNSVGDEDSFDFGNVRLRVLETPGHTFESISIALYDQAFGDDAVAVFTGDTLFIGDVGRADFFPDRAHEVAGLLYDSIFQKILPLGDQAILYPAHGAGSVCGSGMASREFSTLGYERRLNPRLQLDRDAFITSKVNEHHYYIPYFKRMEQLNQEGAGEFNALPRPRALTADQLAEHQKVGGLVLDTRDPEAIAGSFIPGSFAIPLHMVPAFAGWYLPYDRDIALLLRRDDEVEQAVRLLVRLGYDRISGFLAGGMMAWQTSGRHYDDVTAVHVDTLLKRINSGADYTLLDVRSLNEFKQGHLPDAQPIYVGELAERITEVSKTRPVTTFCGSGQRAIIAAALLKQHGIEQVEICLGSMQACKAVGCSVINEQAA
ncbi:MAG: MBL fold metallo-hydrolase [Candidatus Competibacteraceae bacterium]|jgi:hydroxyacylglutathione hydrolase|nr:MBL fold metallo-hydrolase [Candidatus Competibacteraceae bacterium]